MKKETNISKEAMQDTLEVSTSGKSLFKKLIWSLLVIALLALLAWLFFKESKTETTYTTVTPVNKDLIVTVSATGNLEPTNSVDVGIEVSGTISEIYVDYNDIVTKGQILAKLDTTKLESQVNSAKANLRVAEANLQESRVAITDTKRELNRVEKLYKATDGNYPSQKEIDAARVAYQKAKAGFEAVRAQVDQATASLKSNEDDLKKAVVISPMNGVVLDKAVEVGQSVVSSLQMPTLFTIAEDLKKMEVVVSVDEADVGEVRKGQAVSFTVDAYSDRVFEGEIEQVRMNSEIVNNVVTYETVVTVDNSDLLLRPGMTVTADITTQVIADHYLIPNAALRYAPPKTEKEESGGFVLFGPPQRKEKTDLGLNSKSIWILEANAPTQIPVKLGESDGTYTVVLEGTINEQTQIITGSSEKK